LAAADAGTLSSMDPRTLPTRRQAIVMCVFVVFTALTCAALLFAAALVPAPPVVLPFVIAVCIPAPMLAAWELRPSVAALRADRHTRRHAEHSRLLAEMRGYLEQLPETEHPLGD
jgi:hypothetical protein